MTEDNSTDPDCKPRVRRSRLFTFPGGILETYHYGDDESDDDPGPPGLYLEFSGADDDDETVEDRW
jgi:hypothetical protein